MRGLHRAKRPALHSLSPAQARIAYAAGSDVLELDKPALPWVEALRIPARDGTALPAVRSFAPRKATEENGATLPVLLYLHGGDFTR